MAITNSLFNFQILLLARKRRCPSVSQGCGHLDTLVRAPLRDSPQGALPLHRHLVLQQEKWGVPTFFAVRFFRCWGYYSTPRYLRQVVLRVGWVSYPPTSLLVRCIVVPSRLVPKCALVASMAASRQPPGPIAVSQSSG